MDDFDINQFKELFQTTENLYLFPPYIRKNHRVAILKIWKSLKLESHVFIFSSGTTSSELFKTYALSKKSLMANATAVNQFLNATEKDIWLCALPFYHIGGLSIYVRSRLAHNHVTKLEGAWCPFHFMEKLNKSLISFCSLVPTQLYDLVELNLIPPSYLKGVFIGGDFLATQLRYKALSLGWPIIETYGMTESSSQIASSYSKDIIDGYLKVLPIHSLATVEKGEVFLASESLYTALITIEKGSSIIQFVANNKILIPDDVELLQNDNGKFLRPLGRKGFDMKIKGRLVNFLEIRDVFEGVLMDLNLWGKAQIKIIKSERQGSTIQILLLREKIQFLEDLLNNLKDKMPALIDRKTIILVDLLNKTSLGKFKE